MQHRAILSDGKTEAMVGLLYKKTDRFFPIGYEEKKSYLTKLRCQICYNCQDPNIAAQCRSDY